MFILLGSIFLGSIFCFLYFGKEIKIKVDGEKQQTSLEKKAALHLEKYDKVYYESDFDNMYIEVYRNNKFVEKYVCKNSVVLYEIKTAGNYYFILHDNDDSYDITEDLKILKKETIEYERTEPVQQL